MHYVSLHLIQQIKRNKAKQMKEQPDKNMNGQTAQKPYPSTLGGDNNCEGDSLKCSLNPLAHSPDF